MTRKRFLALLLGVTVFAGVLRTWGLSTQPLTEDDRSVAVSAANYIHTGHPGPTMWNHPPLRNLLVYASLRTAGTGPWGLKLWSILLGTLTVPLIALTARRLTGSCRGGLTAALLYAMDGLHIDFSRQAVHEVYTACLGMAGVWAALRFRETGRWRWLAASAVLFGFGLSSKWDAAFPLLVVLVFLVVTVWKDRASQGRLARIGLISTVMGILPASIYLAVHLPVFRRGLDLSDVAAMQVSMLGETAVHQGYNAYALLELTNNPAWWFVKPVGYADFVLQGGHPVVFIGLTHPLLWMAVLPGIYFIVRKYAQERKSSLLLVVALFLATYLPFLLAGRPIWVHSGFPAAGFGAIAAGHLIAGIPNRRFLIGYLLAAFLILIPLWLLATGHGFDLEWLKPVVEMYRPAADRGI